MTSEVTPEGYRLISNSQWRYLHSKINHLTQVVHDTRREFRETQRPKRGLMWHELVPPESVCRDVLSMMIGASKYTGMIARLSDYYGVESMGCYVDPNISPKYVAEYRPATGNAYSREETVSRKSILHEFYHHLEHNDVIPICDDREERADRFARVFLRRASQ